jgi:hypothetical protein
MAKIRAEIPKSVRESVLKEFNHRCAVCGEDRPHLHHIDEEPANNDPMNLIPLCPNCHLGDQHDASNAIPRPKLLFFRRHKHRLILSPQFNSLIRRLAFLGRVTDSDSVLVLEERVNELSTLVGNLAMGGFFSEQLLKLLTPPKHVRMLVLGDPASEARHAAAGKEFDILGSREKHVQAGPPGGSLSGTVRPSSAVQYAAMRPARRPLNGY